MLEVCFVWEGAASGAVCSSLSYDITSSRLPDTRHPERSAPSCDFTLVAGLLTISGVVSWDGIRRTYLILVDWRWGLCRLVRWVCGRAQFLSSYAVELGPFWEGGSLYVV